MSGNPYQGDDPAKIFAEAEEARKAYTKALIRQALDRHKTEWEADMLIIESGCLPPREP